jgi:hypothetical protein
MSPEEHFRRLKDDTVWRTAAAPEERAPQAARVPNRQRDRGPIWVTAAVAAALVVLTVGAVRLGATAPHGGEVGGRAVSASGTPSPARTAAKPTPSVSPSDPDLREYEFYPDNPADMARAKVVIACFKSHGVKIVGLVPSEQRGIKSIGYGGPQNDQESITKGLQYQNECMKAGGTN